MATPVPGQAEVLIVGGGVVGLSAAVFLRAHGVGVTLVEKHPATSRLPRSRNLNSRSMEVYRSVGLEPAVRAARPSVFAQLPLAIRAATLGAPEVFRSHRPAGEAGSEVSPCPPALIDQDTLEPVVRAHAERSGARLCFSTELVSWERAGSGVRATVADVPGGATTEVTCDYLLAADGHRSGVRAALGIGTRGPATPPQVATMVFDADLSRYLGGRPVSLCYLERPWPGTLLTPYDRPGSWALMVPCGPSAAGSEEEFTEQRCQEMIEAAAGGPVTARLREPVPGRPGLVQTWELGAHVAERYREGPVFLAGDAAHVMPPAGGFGANTGIQDVHNLAWKLTAVLRGHAAEQLLDSYEAERRPVAEHACAHAVARLGLRTRGGGDAAAAVDTLTLTFGYRYVSAAVLGANGPGPAFTDPRSATGEPGTRAVHIPLGSGSVLDSFGPGWTLVCGTGDEAWAQAARCCAAELRVPLTVTAVDESARMGGRPWREAYGLAPGGASLVRPDGFVGWRTERGPATATALADALTTLLGRDRT